MFKNLWTLVCITYDKSKLEVQALLGIVGIGTLPRHLPDSCWSEQYLLQSWIMQLLVSMLIVVILLTTLFYRKVRELESQVSKLTSKSVELSPKEHADKVRKELSGSWKRLSHLFNG